MRKYVLTVMSLSLIITSCIPPKGDAGLSTSVSRQNPLLYGFNETINFADLQEGDILVATNIALAEAASILENQGGKTWVNWMGKYA